MAAELDRRASTAHAILVGEFSSTESYLAEKDTWIDSILQLKVTTIVKDGTPSLVEPGRIVTIMQDGGELILNKVFVTAGYFYRFRPGEKYLVFLRGRAGDTGTVGIPLRITDTDLLAPMEMSHGRLVSAPSALYGQPLEKVLAELKRRVNPLQK